MNAFITDTYGPATGASGATGKTHDWGISRELRALSPKPLILAGGLTPDNVCEAISFVRLAGVDAHTGVEDAEGRKDTVRVQAFVAVAPEGIPADAAGGIPDHLGIPLGPLEYRAGCPGLPAAAFAPFGDP